MIILRKVGKVLNVEGDKVYIVTKDNEFCTIRKNNIVPEKGAAYAGEVYKKSSPFKKLAIIFFSFVFIAFLVEGFLYFRPKSNLIVDMNSSFKISVNNLGIIIKIEGNNSKGREILKSTKIKYKSLDEGLTELLTKSISKDLIGTPKSPTSQITIFVVEGPKKFNPTYENFKNAAKNKDIKVTINNDGNGIIE